MGVDVIYTNYKVTDRKYYITTFYKQGDELTPLDIAKSIVNPLMRSFKKPTDDLLTEQPTAEGADQTNTYLVVLPTYIRIREEVHQFLLGKIRGLGAEIAERIKTTRPNNDTGELYLHNLLRTYVVLTHFRTFCPVLEDDTAECQTLYTTLQGVASGAVELTDTINLDDQINLLLPR